MYYIHINRNIIDSNRKNGTQESPITIKRGKNGKSRTASDVRLPVGSRIVYDSAGVLSCGAKVVIECPTEPVFVAA